MAPNTLTQQPVQLPHPNRLLVIEPLDYPNPYDYHTPHRHDYFEIILVKSGSGSQYIDFNPHTISGGQLFTVYPGQVHLMERNTADGLLIQFRKDVFEYIHPLQHYHLYFANPVFNPESTAFNHLYSLTENMLQLLQQDELSPLAVYKAYSYLQIILISITELKEGDVSFNSNHLLSQFLSLLPQNIRERKKVNEYCDLLGCTPEKLSHACKASLGKNALELIHEELMLEIRRLFVLSPLSLKEIAFELNFDGPANFSSFIKSRTGLTPTELQMSLQKIYK